MHHRAAQPAGAVDYRIYLPRLWDDFVKRDGRLEVRPLNTGDVGRDPHTRRIALD